jgi:hypothetical protein
MMFFNSENAAAEGLWKKTRGAKVQKTDFLTALGNPAKPPRDYLFSHSPDCCLYLSNKIGKSNCR